MTYATNQEKLSSTVFRSIMRSVKADAQLREVLGDAIRPQPEWWLNGDPHITGHVSFRTLVAGCSRMLNGVQISQLQGNIDVSFRVKGSKGARHTSVEKISSAHNHTRVRDSLLHKHTEREGCAIHGLCVVGRPQEFE